MAVTSEVVSALSSKFSVSTGIGTVSIAAVGTEIDAGVLDPDAADDPTKWRSVFPTLAETWSVAMADATKTTISTDQDGIIATSKVVGDFTVGFTIPDVSRDQMALFFTETSYDDTDAGYGIMEVGTSLKTVTKALRVDLDNGDIIVFSNLEMNGALTKASADAFSVVVTATVLAYDGREIVFGYKK